MNAIVIASFVVVGTLLLGAFLAALVRVFSKAIDNENAAYKAGKASFQPAVTMGHQIPVDANLEDQLQEARKLAARQAAFLPRGANAGIGQPGSGQQQTSFDGIESDPVSAVRIAHFHGWAGLRTGAQEAPPAAVVAPVKGVAEAVSPVKGNDDLVPGKDYPFIEITVEMSPAEKRKARIANAKAKSAALKQAKASATIAVAQPSAQPGTPPPIPSSESVVVSSDPVAGVDYEVIEINDDMPPEEIRKARIANAKAKSAAKKRFKESGGVSAVAAQSPAGVVEQAPPPPSKQEDASSSPVNTVPSDIPMPNYIEISDNMDKDAMRKARIQNAKEKSAYNKALRAAGIDPKTLGS